MMLTILKPTDPKSSTFEATLTAAKGGDQDSINALFAQFYQQVRRMVHHSLATDLRRSRPWLAAKFSTGDVVQEVFRSVLDDLESFGGHTERAFAGYLTMVVRNRIIDAIRFHEAERRDGRRSVAPVHDDVHVSGEANPTDEAAGLEALERFHAALAEFPERERLLLRARFEGTASFAELADQLGFSSVYSVRRAFFAAQATLSVRLRPLDEEDAE